MPRRNPPPAYAPEGMRLASHFRAIQGHKYRPDMAHAVMDLARQLAPLEAWFAGRYGVEFPSDMAVRGYAEAWSLAHTRARRHYADTVNESSEEEDIREYGMLGAEAQTADAAAWAAGTIAAAMYDANPMPSKAALRAIDFKIDALTAISGLESEQRGRHVRERAKLARKNRMIQ